jgi:hypothetical protein
VPRYCLADGSASRRGSLCCGVSLRRRNEAKRETAPREPGLISVAATSSANALYGPADRSSVRSATLDMNIPRTHMRRCAECREPSMPTCLTRRCYLLFPKAGIVLDQLLGPDLLARDRAREGARRDRSALHRRMRRH